MSVEAYVGYHGNGKTYNALAEALMHQQDKGTPIVTNAIVRGAVRAPAWVAAPEGAPMPAVVHFETWDELDDLLMRMVAGSERARLIIDEAGKFVSSRYWQKLDPRVLLVLQERRKIGRGLDLVYTVPAFKQVDTNLRDVTQVVHECKRIGGSEYGHDDGKHPRAFVVRTYRAEEYESSKRKPTATRVVPFSRTLADCYSTGIVSMGTPMAAKHSAKPTLRDPDPPDPTPVVVTAAPAPPTRRARRKS